MTGSTSRSYHHGALRDALLQRAAEVIEAQGVERLTLRGLARDLNVSHGAPNRHFANREELLTTLATDAWEQMRQATLARAEAAPDDSWIRLNAMGRGFLTWAIQNRSLFSVIVHPDVARYAGEALEAAVDRFQETVRAAVAATQANGRHPQATLDALNLYTNAVPFGAAMLVHHPLLARPLTDASLDAFVAEIIELVVPIADRAG